MKSHQQNYHQNWRKEAGPSQPPSDIPLSFQWVLRIAGTASCSNSGDERIFITDSVILTICNGDVRRQICRFQQNHQHQKSRPLVASDTAVQCLDLFYLAVFETSFLACWLWIFVSCSAIHENWDPGAGDSYPSGWWAQNRSIKIVIVIVVITFIIIIIVIIIIIIVIIIILIVMIVIIRIPVFIPSDAVSDTSEKVRWGLNPSKKRRGVPSQSYVYVYVYIYILYIMCAKRARAKGAQANFQNLENGEKDDLPLFFTKCSWFAIICP